MKEKKGPIDGLKSFLPKNTFDRVAPFFDKYYIILTIKQDRKKVLGDYTNPVSSREPHKISINGNLNPYAFLVTLLHEIAHLETYVKYKHTVASHGTEWKRNFQKILIPFIENKLLPRDICLALTQHVYNTKATTCSDPLLYKTLAKHDKNRTTFFVDELPFGTVFINPGDGKRYKILSKRRTRYECIQLENKSLYSFPGIADVIPTGY